MAGISRGAPGGDNRILIPVTIDRTVRDILRRLATAQDRSLGNYCRQVLTAVAQDAEKGPRHAITNHLS